MDTTGIITIFVITDSLMEQLGHRSHALAGVSAAEVITVAVVAATYFQNHHERALAVMQATHHLSGALSTSRFNRRLHAVADWLAFVSATLGEVLTTGEVFVIDSLPLPVCKRAGASIVAIVPPRGAVLRLALAPDLHAQRGAGALYAVARRAA